MAAGEKDPTDPMRLRASRYPGVDEGTACTQSSFKAGERAFLYVGKQGGRYKAMFKLERSRPEAARLAERDPDGFEVGSTAWVTARFSADRPMPRKLWEKWLDESYELSVAPGAASKKAAAQKIGSRKVAAKKAAGKKTVNKKAANKKPPARKAAGKTAGEKVGKKRPPVGTAAAKKTAGKKRRG